MARSEQGAKCLLRRRTEGGRAVLEITENTLNEIESLRCNLIVIVAVGHVRSGKSYVLNRLFLGKDQGFAIGHNVVPETRGVWVRVVDCPSLENVKLVVLDVEGFGQTGEDDTYMEDMIQGIVLSVSSVIIVNGNHTIEETDIEKLALHLEISRQLHPTATVSENSTPSLVYLIQNFVLKRRFRDDDYLENILRLDNKEANNSNRAAVRRRIRKYFLQRKCFILSPPVRDWRIYKKLPDTNEDDLSSSYKQKIHEIHTYLTEAMPIMTVDDAQVTGKEWASRFRSCVKKANTRTIPKIPGTLELLQQSLNVKEDLRWESDRVGRDSQRCMLGNPEIKGDFITRAILEEAGEYRSIVIDTQKKLHRLGPESLANKHFTRDGFCMAAIGEKGGLLSLPDFSVSLDVAPNTLESDVIIFCHRRTPIGPKPDDLFFYSVPMSCGPQETVLRRPVLLKLRHCAEIVNSRQKECLVVLTRTRHSESFQVDETCQLEIDDKWATVRMQKLCDVAIGTKLSV